MRETIVLIHGSANGSFSWAPVQRALAAAGAKVVAPDMLGYGNSPEPSAAWNLAEETAHLARSLAAAEGERLHLVAHSLGTLFALHLRHALGGRVTRLTLVDPVLVNVLRGPEPEALAEMETQWQRFLGLWPDLAATGKTFTEHWNGVGSWERLGERARATITRLMPKVRMEIEAANADLSTPADYARAPVPTTILVGGATRLAPPAVARQLAPAFDARTILVPGAGHMIPLTHSPAVVETVLAEAR